MELLIFHYSAYKLDKLNDASALIKLSQSKLKSYKLIEYYLMLFFYYSAISFNMLQK